MIKAMLFLFLIGISIGSFLSVVSMRYKPNDFILRFQNILGRSHCPGCQKKLSWYELIPLISFVIQRGKCRNCKKKLSLQYPIVEFISGLIFVLIPLYFKKNLYLPPEIQLNRFYFVIFNSIWFLIAINLILVFLIDLKLKIIPNELIIFILILGFGLNILTAPHWNEFYSFLGAYSLIFGTKNNMWINKAIGFLFGLLFFSLIVVLTRGKGMGIGDVKLMAGLGFIFGWPDILIITLISFILGGIVGAILLVTRKKNRKSLIPFGPFIVLSSFIILFYGEQILKIYFNIIDKINVVY